MSELAYELWTAAQLRPGEGIEDGVARVEEVLRTSIEPDAKVFVGYGIVKNGKLDDDLVSVCEADVDYWIEEEGGVKVKLYTHHMPEQQRTV